MSRGLDDIAARLFSAETIESAREVFSSMNPDEKAKFLAFRNPNHFHMGFLHLACVSGKALAVQVLLESGADLRVVSNNGDTALHLASLIGASSVVQALLRAGADLRAVTNNGSTALHASKNAEVVNAILAKIPWQERLAFVQAQNRNGDTALHLASARAALSAVQALLRAGSDVRAVNNNGSTALHVFLNHCGDKDPRAVAEVLEQFLAKNADILAMNQNGNTPLGIAIEKCNVSIKDASVVSSDARIFSAALLRFYQHLPIARLRSEAAVAPAQNSFDGQAADAASSQHTSERSAAAAAWNAIAQPAAISARVLRTTEAAASAAAVPAFVLHERAQSASAAASAPVPEPIRPIGGSGSAFARVAPVSSSASTRAVQQRSDKRKEPSAAAAGRT